MTISKRCSRYWTFLIASTVTTGSYESIVYAADTDDRVLEEIVVTAQKRQQHIEDVPISIVALGGQEVQKLDISGTNDLTRIVPGLEEDGPYGGSNSEFRIRGIGTVNFTQNYQAPVGIYADEVYLGSPVDSALALFDLDRVEVLRGPQGTLFGKNTTGGAISVFSAEPTKDLEGSVTLRYGNYDYREFTGDISIPISDDLSIRAAGESRARDGTLQNLAGGPDLNDVDQRAARITALYTPSSTFRAKLVLGAGFNDGNGEFADSYSYLASGGNPFKGSYNAFGLEQVAARSATLDLRWQLDGMELTSITGYRNNDLHRKEEPDTSTGTDGNFQVEWKSHFWQVSQELRLGSKEHGADDWVAGLYFYRDHLVGNNAAEYPDPGEAFALNFRPAQDVRDLAVFAQDTHSLTDRLRLTVGARFTDEHQDFAYENIFAPMTNPFGVGLAPSLSYQDSTTYNAWSGKLGLEYDVSAHSLLYASVSRGFNAGGHAGLAFSDAQLQPSNPEYIYAYEVGSKSTFADGRASLFASAFYYDYRNIIVATTVDLPGQATLADVTTNAARARIDGFEIEGMLRPVKSLRLNASIAYLEAIYTSFQSALLTGNYTGNTLPESPRWSFTADATYTIPVGGKQNLIFEADARHLTSVFSDTENTSQLKISGNTVANARVDLDWGNGLSVGLWSKNIFGKTYVTYAYTDPSIASVTGGQPYGYFFGDPRTYGLEVGYKF